ncbi:hypothetical protein [Cellvibrio sp. UBA7671]|uniref:hypothetical protein n=1 Tax=Cellvibrio sp. UBA7671 TaxID=1946312 RepID=UPI002F351591
MINDKLVEIILKNRKEQKRAKRIRFSKLAWILDTEPYETHQPFLRTVDERSAREKLRHQYSWHNLLRLQNEKAFKAGLVGIVTAPILAGLSNTESFPINLQFPNQMGLIFLSGLLYVIATAICNFRAPYFVQLYLMDEAKRKYRATPFSEIGAEIFKEFSKLAYAFRITPDDFHGLKPSELELASAIHHQGGEGYKMGFSPRALAFIDKFLHTLSETHDFKLFESRDNKLQIKHGPGEIYTGGIYIRHLYIESAHNHYLNMENSLNLSSKDIVIDNINAPLQFEAVSSGDAVEPYIYGLTTLIREEYLNTFIEELSYWQSRERPFSRIAVFWMYRLALITFTCFLIYQAFVVWQAVDFSHIYPMPNG